MNEMVKVNAEILSATKEYDILKDTIDCIVIDSDDSHKKAIEFGSKINQFTKALEEKRKEIVKPINDEVKRINDSFKPITSAFEALNQTLKGKILPYTKLVEERRLAWVAEQRAKELAEMESKKKALLDTAVESGSELALQMASIVEDTQVKLAEKEVTAKAVVRSGTAKATVRRVWKFEVTDASKVPLQFLSVDEKKVSAFLKEKKDEISKGLVVDGIRFYEDESISY